jgi:integrase
VWRTLVKPRWGDTRLDRVTHGEVVRWVAELTERGLSPSRITQALLCLKQVLALAVMDGRLARNAAEHVKPPRPRKAEPRFLTHEQVHELAEACGQYRVFVLTAAYTGLRWGELRALRVKRIDLERGRIDVAEAMPERSLELDTPKNHKRRTVPIPGFVIDGLEKHIQGKAPDDLVFTNSAGRMLDNTNFRRNIWNPAARSIGLEGFTPHDLRHTTASLAVSAGANVKALQRLLGHASASMTLDVYSALFDSDLDAVAERLGTAAEGWLRKHGTKVVNPEGAGAAVAITAGSGERLENESNPTSGTTAVTTVETQSSGLRRNVTLTVSWELTGSGAIALADNLLLTRRVVRREGIEPPTR